MRRAALILLLALAGCGGGGQQGSDEPKGEFRVEIVDASFPRVQHIAGRVQLKLRVKNDDQRTLNTVAVTVTTNSRIPGDAEVSFGQQDRDGDLSSAARPIWILEDGPKGGDTAYVNTWLAGPLKAGEERELTWSLVPSRAGTYKLSYSVAPGLTGRATAAHGRTRGTRTVRILDQPVPARVGDDGRVERGVEPGT